MEMELVGTDKKASNRPMQIRSSKAYELNVDKNLCKKLAATKRAVNVLIEEKDGGTVVTADAATFELIKRAAVVLYSDFPPEIGHAKIEEVTDNSKKHIVQYIIRVCTTQNQAYTINIYLTTSRLLVNGKNALLFLDNDFPKIQTIIRQASYAGQPLNIDKLNKLMSSQIRAVLSNRTDKQNEAVVLDEEDIRCLKCKRSCKSRGSFCTYGSHWIHYNCERLNKEEITAIEKSKDDKYRCKICSDSSPNKITLKIPAIKPLSPEQKGDLIEEETITHESSFDFQENDKCAVCGETIESAIAELCDSCESSCHTECMYSENTCIYCQETVTQDNETEPVLNSSLPYPTSQVLSQSSSNPTIITEINGESQRHKSKYKSKSIQTVIKGTEMDTKEIKLSELRSKETKLRKFEEELKIREKSLDDRDKERLKLETYIKKLESRVQEMELTIKTLKQQSDPQMNCALPKMQQVSTENPINPVTDQFNEQVMNIHKRVTSIVIKQIDMQLDKLEESLVSNTDCSSNQTTYVPVKLRPEQSQSAPVYRSYDNVINSRTVVDSQPYNTGRYCFRKKRSKP